MKIAILTQPLHHNYGGLLQAYALQYYLKKQGHDVLTVDFVTDHKPKLWGIKSIVLGIIKKFILNKPVEHVLPLTSQEKRSISQHTDRFRAENIRTTQRITSLSEFLYIKNYNFDAYVVGSDQVWRPEYSPGMSAFFLDFLGDDNCIKRVAYAASFGVDHCDEFSQSELNKYGRLLQKFDAVGVRENSAVTLCKQHFGVEVCHVIDPTMLLEKDDYSCLVENDNAPISNGNMLVYVLDKSQEKQSIIDSVAKVRGFKPYTVMPEQHGVFPAVTQWLRGFMDAQYVVTDSFHGVVFSIIFNKPFIAIGNSGRGLARFTSLLNMFALEDRLISNVNQLTEDVINSQIDFSRVNNILKTQKLFASEFLNDALRVEQQNG
jgi:hypothetical protein